MLQQHFYKVRCACSKMLILQATLIVTLAPTITLAQTGSSNLSASTQPPSTSASQLSPLSEANCQPSNNPKEEKESFCAGDGPDVEVPIDPATGRPFTTPSPVTPIRTDNSPACRFEFGQGDWKTVCIVLQF
jgi:hypothetical protein